MNHLNTKSFCSIKNCCTFVLYDLCSPEPTSNRKEERKQKHKSRGLCQINSKRPVSEPSYYQQTNEENRLSGLRFVHPWSCSLHLCKLVCQLNDLNVKQSLSGTPAVLTHCLSASIPAVPMFPLKLRKNPPTAWKWSCFTLRQDNSSCY